jgi:hypothetical protein
LPHAKHPVLARTIRSLGRRCGFAESTVRKWIASEDWPFSLRPPWDVARVKAWHEIQRHPDPAAAYRKRAAAAEAGTGEFAGMGPLTKAKLQATIERALLVRQRRMIEAGKMHDTEQCEQRRLRQIHEVRAALLGLGRSVANSLVGQPREAIERVIHDRCLQICEEFADAGNANKKP